MKIFFASFAFILVFSVFAIAQTEKRRAFIAQSQIGVIDTNAFLDEKTGIQEFVEANKKLEDEFKSRKEELRILSGKVQKMKEGFREITGPRRPGEPTVKEMEIKLKEYKLALSKLKSGQEEVKSLYEKRKAEIFNLPYETVRKSLSEFSKRNGYAIIFDKNKLENCIITGDFEDVTTDFIQFYNNLGEK